MDSCEPPTDTEEEEDGEETEGCKPTLSTRLQNIGVTPYRWVVLAIYSLTGIHSLEHRFLGFP